MKKIIFILSTCFFLSSCEAPTTVVSRGVNTDIEKERIIMQGIALETFYKRLEKLNNFAWPILSSSKPFCKSDTKYDIGIIAISLDDLRTELRQAAKEKIGISKELKILFLIKNSPSFNTDLRKGDIIREIKSKNFKWTNEDINKNIRLRNFNADTIRITIDRDGQILSYNITPALICNYGIILSQNNNLNAYADGRNIFVTQGMMRFIEEDKELQFILSHELVHNSENHISKRVNNSILGTILDIAASSAGVNTRGTFGNIGAQMYSQDFEREADYISMYILALAEIDTRGVENFWRRLSAENPRSIDSYNSSHPTSPERWANIAATRKEIEYKINNNIELVPERKDKS